MTAPAAFVNGYGDPWFLIAAWLNALLMVLAFVLVVVIAVALVRIRRVLAQILATLRRREDAQQPPT